MKAITQYQADDGTVYSTAEGAALHDRVDAACKEILSAFPPKPDLPGCAFENGHGYLQHKPETVALVRISLLKVAQEFTDHKWIQQSIDNPDTHASWAGRIIDESCPRPVWRAWHRIYCIDAQNREWGQPYYAMNPDKGDQVCLNREPA